MNSSRSYVLGNGTIGTIDEAIESIKASIWYWEDTMRDDDTLDIQEIRDHVQSLRDRLEDLAGSIDE